MESRGRLQSEPGKEYRDIVIRHEATELGKDSFDPLLELNIAHVLMLYKQKLLPRASAEKLLTVLREIWQNGLECLDTSHVEDLYFALEKKVFEAVDIKQAGNLHLGRSRNDLYHTVYKMILRDKIIDLLGKIIDFSKKEVDLAGTHLDTVMPGYTHTQHAQPITLGYYLLGFSQAICRDVERFRNALRFVNESPLGAAALSTTSHPLDRAYTAELLGFDSFTYNAYDAISGRDYLNDAATAICTYATNLSRIADDFLTWNTFEFGFLELSDDFTVISSIMPQKKNASSLEFVRSASSWILGDTFAVLSAAKGVTYSDIKDAAKYNYSPLWHSFEIASDITLLFSAFLPKIRWNTERMLKVTREGYSTMTDLADYIVGRFGLTFREAHHVVALFVKESISMNAAEPDAGILNDVAAKQGCKFDISPDELKKVLDPKECLGRKNVAGGTSPAEMNKMWMESERKLAEFRNWHKGLSENLKTVRAKLFNWEEEIGKLNP